MQARVDEVFPKAVDGASGRRIAQRTIEPNLFSRETLLLLEKLTGHRFDNIFYSPQLKPVEEPPPHTDEEYSGIDTRFGGDMLSDVPPDPTSWECNVFADEPLYLERDLQPLRMFLDELEPSEYDIIHHKELYKMYRLCTEEPVIKEDDFKDILSREIYLSHDGYIKGFKLKPQLVKLYQQKTKEWIEKNMGWGNYIRSLTTTTS